MGGMAGLLGTGMQVGGSIADMQGRQKAQKQQQENLNNWYLYQALIRNQEYMRQDAYRQQADTSRQNVLNNDVSSTAQKFKQGQEADRLATEYAKGTSAAADAPSASDEAIRAGTQPGILAGQSGGDKEFRSDLARRLNNGASRVRDRIKALGTMNSYGDSFMGLGTENPLAFQRSGWDINQANNFRKGSLQAFQVEKAIQPQQVQYRGSPLSMAMNAAGGLVSGLGNAAGGGGMF
jgi:hypothetical protein